MTSYHINLEKDTLKVGFNNKISATGDQIVRDAWLQLQQLINSGQLSGGSLLKIHGRSSVLLSYVLAHELGHLYEVIAVSDPRIGGEKQNRYVVTISYSPDYAVGDVLECINSQVHHCRREEDNFDDTKNRENISFLLSLQGDTLKVSLNPQVRVSGDQVVRDTVVALEQLIASGKLTGGSLLKINGRATLLSSYILAHRLAHLYGAIAVFDPKIGNPQLNSYVVVTNHGSGYQIGEVLDTPTRTTENVKVVLCGSANTGKTCLREGLKQAILTIPDGPDSYVISGCPDGDGSWFSETAQQYPGLAKELKNEYKAKFTMEFAQSKAREIAAIKTSLLLFDVGGKVNEDGTITQENQLIMAKGTHAVILAKTDVEVSQWQGFCHQLNLPVVAIIYSDYHGSQDFIETESPIWSATFHYLERGVDISVRPCVQKLAQLLADLAS